MTATLDRSQRASLEEADSQLAQWQEAVEIAVEQGAFDADQLFRLKGTLRDLVAAVNAGLAPTLDLDAANEIRDRLLRLITLKTGEQERPLDVADRALIEAEAIRHVVRDLLAGDPPSGLTAAQAITQTQERVPRLGVTDLARLLGVDRRSIPRLRSSAAPPDRRLMMVWKLVALLHRSWTDEGVLAWFERPRNALSGRTPMDALGDVAWEPQLINLARRGRTQRAS